MTARADQYELTFEQQLERYADLLVRVGVGLTPGQHLRLRVPVEHAPLGRLCVQKAYQAGARFVDVQWEDDAVTLARFQFAPRDSFGEYPHYRAQGLLEHTRGMNASLTVLSGDPDLLAGQDHELVALAERTTAEHTREARTMIMSGWVNWALAAAPDEAWARKVFPHDEPERAVRKLWELIFRAVRLNEPDPVSAWQSHLEELARRRDHLNERRFAALQFRGPGTDLTVGLANGHQWQGGAKTTIGGQVHVANLPTEEVFTAPHRERVDGVVSATKPLSHNGVLIEGIRIRFEKGCIVEAHADRGEDVLRTLIDTDEGSRRLGEVALVPHSSPISQMGVLFYETLFDENAASHIAIGKAYRYTVRGGADMTDEHFEAVGGNDSLEHVDWMIGSAEVDVDGVHANGTVEPVMRQGEWAY